MKTKLLMLLVLLGSLWTSNLYAQTRYPKREFRGAWIQCVNGQFQGMPTEKMKKVLVSQLDNLQKAGINAIIFQVRAEADALYKSPYEPWSRFLTGVQGKAPSPMWDPLQFMIEECHKRNMELHAWINPYRAKTKGTGACRPCIRTARIRNCLCSMPASCILIRDCRNPENTSARLYATL